MNKHILVVEDEEQTRFSMTIVLKRAGYMVTATDDGLKAFNLIKDQMDSPTPIDFLLTDIQLPRLTGLELIDKLSEEEMSLPCLVITGYGDKEMVMELMRRGCEEYIDKPFEPVELVDRVGMVFEKKGVTDGSCNGT